MTDTTTTTTTGEKLDGATAEPGPLAFTLPADLAAATWHAVAAVTAHARNHTPVLEGVHVATGPDGVTLTATDTFAAHRVTLPRSLDGSFPFLPHPATILPAWKATDLARLAKDATTLRFTAGTFLGDPARCEARDASGAVIGSLAAPVPADPDKFPQTASLWELDAWPGYGARVGLDPARFARTMTAADKFRGKDDRATMVLESADQNRPLRFTLTRRDGARLDAVLMAMLVRKDDA